MRRGHTAKYILAVAHDSFNRTDEGFVSGDFILFRLRFVSFLSLFFTHLRKVFVVNLNILCAILCILFVPSSGMKLYPTGFFSPFFLMGANSIECNFITLNVKSIIDRNKRGNIYSWCIDKCGDIIFLQETFSTPDIERDWSSM